MPTGIPSRAVKAGDRPEAIRGPGLPGGVLAGWRPLGILPEGKEVRQLAFRLDLTTPSDPVRIKTRSI